jgi:hypothetical protein
MKIILAVDGSEYTKKALAYLMVHDSLLGPEVELLALHVQPPMPPRVKRMVGSEAIASYHKDEAEKVLAPVTRFHQAQGELSHRLESGFCRRGNRQNGQEGTCPFDRHGHTWPRHAGPGTHGFGGAESGSGVPRSRLARQVRNSALYCSRSKFFCTLPMVLRGNSATM